MNISICYYHLKETGWKTSENSVINCRISPLISKVKETQAQTSPSFHPHFGLEPSTHPRCPISINIMGWQPLVLETTLPELEFLTANFHKLFMSYFKGHFAVNHLPLPTARLNKWALKSVHHHPLVSGWKLDTEETSKQAKTNRGNRLGSDRCNRLKPCS